MKKQDYIAAAHRKLKGKWRSDGKKTMSRWVFPKRIAERESGEKVHHIFFDEP
jgi:hypothetical protein